MPGYGSAAVSCTFAPTEQGPVRLPLRLSFRAPAQRKLLVPGAAVTLSGVGQDVPIFLESSVLDFKCSMVGEGMLCSLCAPQATKTAARASL